MRISPPTPAKAGAASRRAGLTILEMLVSSAMLALIIVGLTAMFIQTQKAFKTGIKQTDVGDTGLTLSRMISEDLAQLSDGVGYSTNSQPLVASANTTNLMWSWDTNSIQKEDGVDIRTNQLQSIYMLVHTNTGWTGIGYVVSNLPNVGGVGTLYRYVSPVNGHYFNNQSLYSLFGQAFNQNFSNKAYAANPNVRLSRIADGVVHLKIRCYDRLGNQVGIETNRGDFYEGPITNAYPIVYRPPITGSVVTNNLPSSIDLELGILEPDAWDHLKALYGNAAAQNAYLQTAAGKIDIFHQRILVRAADLQ